MRRETMSNHQATFSLNKVSVKYVTFKCFVKCTFSEGRFTGYANTLIPLLCHCCTIFLKHKRNLKIYLSLFSLQ